jgi:hypothetical protein
MGAARLPTAYLTYSSWHPSADVMAMRHLSTFGLLTAARILLLNSTVSRLLHPDTLLESLSQTAGRKPHYGKH